MNKFFHPQSVAVIGVSDASSNLGKHLIQNLIRFEFKGDFHAVGVESETVLGRPVYRSVRDIPTAVDMAVIFVKAEFVPEVAEECGRKGIRRIVIPSAGFSEFRTENKFLEDRILETCHRYDMRLIGPNCMGVVNLDHGLFIPFGVHIPENWQKGPVGVVSQSGNISLNYSQYLCFERIGVSKVASIGNKLDVDEVDLLQYYLEDPETKIIFLYLEGFSRARDFVALAKDSDKPIIIQKSNRSIQTQGIARSHTTALASDDKLVNAAFKQAGIIRVNNLDELIHCVQVLLLPSLGGNRLAGIASAGGKAVMTADECIAHGFVLPELPRSFLEWRRALGRADYINPTNPLDLGDIYNMDVHIEIIRKLQDLEELDGIFYILPYSASWKDSIDYGKLVDFCMRVNDGSKIPVFIHVDFEAPTDKMVFQEQYAVRFFNSISGTFRALKKVRDARTSGRRSFSTSLV